METMKLLGRGVAVLALITVCMVLTGCQSGNNTANSGYSYDPLSADLTSNNGLPGSGSPAASGGTTGTGTPATGPSTGSALSEINGSYPILHAGDLISVTFNDVNPVPTPIDDTIKEDGSITLYYNEKFQAAGKTVNALQAEIHDRYVPKYYQYMTPSVKTADRFFSVGGEVRLNNRYVWTSGMTVLRAIDAAGGFTDFARKGKVSITRANNQREYEDCVKALKHPELDLPVFPGDQILVHKRFW